MHLLNYDEAYVFYDRAEAELAEYTDSIEMGRVQSYLGYFLASFPGEHIERGRKHLARALEILEHTSNYYDLAITYVHNGFALV